MPRFAFVSAMLMVSVLCASRVLAADEVDRDYDVSELLKPTSAADPYIVPILNAPADRESATTRPAEVDPKQLSTDLVAWANSILSQDPANAGSATESEGKLHVRAIVAAQTRIAGLLDEAIRRRKIEITIETRQIDISPENYNKLVPELRLKLDAVRLPAALQDGLVLDDPEVNAILRGVNVGTIIHAPRVTMHSGQGAQMVFCTLFPYVADLKREIVDGKEKWTPKNSNAEDGFQLCVRASTNRALDAVNSEVDYQWAAFEGFETVTIPGAPAGSLVQKPKLTQEHFHQSVTAPSKKTLLFFTGNITKPEPAYQFILIKATILANP